MEYLLTIWAAILFFLSLLLFYVWAKLLLISNRLKTIRSHLQAIDEIKAEAKALDEKTLY